MNASHRCFTLLINLSINLRGSLGRPHRHRHLAIPRCATLTVRGAERCHEEEQYKDSRE